jgi:hypothetical protein
MKKRKGTKQLAAILLAAGLFLFFGAVSPATNVQQAFAANSQTGNGAPSGSHYNLNLIGKNKTDILPNDSNNGHRIFVNLYASHDGTISDKGNKIYLTQQATFGVIDADATDGRAEFGLPAPFVTGTETRAYYIFVRELGKPGGDGRLTTCYTDELGDDYCLFGVMDVPLQRTNGKPVFRDVTQQLTTLCFDADLVTAGVQLQCENIFSDQLKDYYWNYDNNGLKNVQLRFYPVA